MLLAEERKRIAEYGRRMTTDRLVVGTSGNLSIRAGDPPRVETGIRSSP